LSGVVLDASATLPWCFEDEATPETEALLDDLRDGSFAVVPAHWATEVMNGLLVAQRRGRIDAERVARFVNASNFLRDTEKSHACATRAPLERTGHTCCDAAPSRPTSVPKDRAFF